MNSKDKMQMLCMKNGTTAEGYNRIRERRIIKHSSTGSAMNGGHWKLKSKPKVRSYQLIEALPETANTRLLVLLCDPTSSLPQLTKVVSIETATLKECSATGLAQNRDGKRRESSKKSYVEQCLGFETKIGNRGKYLLSIGEPIIENSSQVLY
ncbi:hypothetical protein F511_33505 [Dorcoceras hygrometricum]|uniref:Uncharacterized protein n=1 Tax=Dorcoceras hygrometricum TaxID=472368 RepID=A0A2Z7DDZ4_9LAMI|nr:hypothetical protein F511_33505 [Dorcoceras hygrometricum]